MTHVASVQEVVEQCENDHGPCELIATAEAFYSHYHAVLLVRVEAFIQPAGCGPKALRLTEDWLPPKETFVEAVTLEQAPQTTKEIFERWIDKVRRSVPATHHH